MCRPKKLFGPNQHLLEYCHTIPFANRQSELACHMNDQIHDIHGLELCIQRSGGVGEIGKFFDSGEYGHYRVSRMVGCLIDNFLLLKNIVRHQLDIVVLGAS